MLTEFDWVEALKVFAPYIFGTLATAIAWFGLHTGAAVNLRNKRVDVISGCNQRYDALAQTKTNIVKSISTLTDNISSIDVKVDLPKSIIHEIDLYYRRYWGLKSDQVDYWLAGYIDPETLISWFMSTIDSLHNPTPIWNEYTVDDGWESVRDFHRVTNQRLYQVAESILCDETDFADKDYQYAYLFDLFRSIEREEETLINLLKRNSFQRLWMDRFRSSLPLRIAEKVVPHELRAARQRTLLIRHTAAAHTQPPDFGHDRPSGPLRPDG